MSLSFSERTLKFSEGIYNAYDRIGIAVICAAMIVTAIGSIIRDRVAA